MALLALTTQLLYAAMLLVAAVDVMVIGGVKFSLASNYVVGVVRAKVPV